jgi:hypothetical protein
MVSGIRRRLSQAAARQETFWYFVYGAVLCIILAIVDLALRLVGRPQSRKFPEIARQR